MQVARPQWHSPAFLLIFTALVLTSTLPIRGYAQPQEYNNNTAQTTNLVPRSPMQASVAGSAAEERELRDANCAGCPTVLISRLQSSSHSLYDNEKTVAQARLLKKDLELAGRGKLKPKLWYTSFRENAEYNVVWTVNAISSTTPETLEVQVSLYELASGQKLYETSRRSIYWDFDQPDEKCLSDVLNFLRNAVGPGAKHRIPIQATAKVMVDPGRSDQVQTRAVRSEEVTARPPGAVATKQVERTIPTDASGSNDGQNATHRANDSTPPIAKVTGPTNETLEAIATNYQPAADNRPRPAVDLPQPSNLDLAKQVPGAGSSCVLADVLNAASKRVEEFVVSMQRISATERVEFDEMDRAGNVRNTARAKFTYVAYIHEVRPHQLTVDEYRDDSVGVQNFPSKLATTGTAAFALIFHPEYLKDFSMHCESLTDMNGRKAWELHFEQSRSNNFRGYRSANLYFPIMLKGRAWIDAETYEVLRLETDLLKAIPEIPLLLDHIAIDYGTVKFPKRSLQLWLPQRAEIDMDYRGHRYRHKHVFSDFQLFWVDTDEKVKGPTGM